jgi:hypothetical protein
MAFPLKKPGLPAGGNMLALVPGAMAMTDFEFGPAKENLANTGAESVDDQVMRFNISGTIGA